MHSATNPSTSQAETPSDTVAGRTHKPEPEPHSDHKTFQVGPARPIAASKRSPSSQWTFLTNHSHVLVLLSKQPSLVLREVAHQVGITERAVQRIIADLEAGGFIERERIGRQNHYRIQPDLALRHPVESYRKIGDLLAIFREVSM